MPHTHLARVSCFGQIGRFQSPDGREYSRGSQVVCRTARGVEIAEILSLSDVSTHGEEADGTILRSLTPEDQLLAARLEKNRHAAYEACASRLSQRGITTPLLDVEHLFDGKTLCFYFLGETSEEIEAITAELAEAYESKAQFQRFAEAVSEGCGPDCGTEEGAGCGSACSSCSIEGSCSTTPLG